MTSSNNQPAVRFLISGRSSLGEKKDKKIKKKRFGRKDESAVHARPQSTSSDIEDDVSFSGGDNSVFDEDAELNCGAIEEFVHEYSGHSSGTSPLDSISSAGSETSQMVSLRKLWTRESDKNNGQKTEDVLLEMDEENEEDDRQSGTKSHRVNFAALPDNDESKEVEIGQEAKKKHQTQKTSEDIGIKMKRLIESLNDPSLNNCLAKIAHQLSRLRNWTSEEEGRYRSQIAELGGIQAITDIMVRTMQDCNNACKSDNSTRAVAEYEESEDLDYILRVQQLGISCLANLSREAALSTTVEASGGYVAIFDAMRHYPFNANLQEKGLDAIATMARIELMRETLMKNYQPIRFIVKAMHRNLGDVYVQRRAFIALYRLSDDAFASHIGGSGVIEKCMTAMRRYPKDAKLQKLGCGLLKALAKREEANKMRVITARGLSTVLQAMAEHENDSGVQEEACRLFGYLSGCHTERKFSIARSGALERVLKAMKSHPDNPKVQVAGCVALYNLTTKLQIAQMANSHAALTIVSKAKKDSPEYAPKIITRLRLARFAPIFFMS